MESRRPPLSTPAANPQPLLPSLFLAFRLVYIPASIFSHTGHGSPVLNGLVVLCATFGLEFLVRRSRRDEPATASQQAHWFVVVALLLLGFFPEEAPTGALLWAGIGAAWASLWPGRLWPLRGSGVLAGGLLGLSGLWGPGSWLMALLLVLWFWRMQGLKKD
ncbi:MAG: hypothetical protein WBO46_17390 [Caldilineaceae bacterium]